MAYLRNIFSARPSRYLVRYHLRLKLPFGSLVAFQQYDGGIFGDYTLLVHGIGPHILVWRLPEGSCWMLRIIVVVFALIAAAYLLLRLARELGKADMDWRGIAFVAGFVVLAFYLRHLTEIGGLG